MDANELPFGNWLWNEIDGRDWSVTEFAERAGVSVTNASRWVNNRRLPDPPSCQKIADALQLDVREVLRRAGHLANDQPDLFAQIPREVRWYFLNYYRLPPDRQRLLLAQLRAYYADLGLPDPTAGIEGLPS